MQYAITFLMVEILWFAIKNYCPILQNK